MMNEKTEELLRLSSALVDPENTMVESDYCKVITILSQVEDIAVLDRLPIGIAQQVLLDINQFRKTKTFELSSSIGRADFSAEAYEVDEKIKLWKADKHLNGPCQIVDLIKNELDELEEMAVLLVSSEETVFNIYFELKWERWIGLKYRVAYETEKKFQLRLKKEIAKVTDLSAKLLESNNDRKTTLLLKKKANSESLLVSNGNRLRDIAIGEMQFEEKIRTINIADHELTLKELYANTWEYCFNRLDRRLREKLALRNKNVIFVSQQPIELDDPNLDVIEHCYKRSELS